LATTTFTNYPDTTYSNTGFRYQVIATSSGGNSSPSAEFPTPRYALIDLGTNFMPIGITTNGLVAGNIFDYTEIPYWGASGASGATWQNGGPVQRLVDSLCVQGINNSGIMVGQDTNNQAAIWTSPNTGPVLSTTSFQTGEADTDFYGATAISDSGLIVGFAAEDNPYHGILATQLSIGGAASMLLPDQFDADTNIVYQVYLTAAGGSHCAGVYEYGSAETFNGSGGYEAGIIIDGTKTPIPGLWFDWDEYFASDFSVEYGINGINASGTAIGSASAGAVAYAGNPLTTTVLGQGEALAINASGQIVGDEGSPMYDFSAGSFFRTGNALMWEKTNYDGTPSTNYVQKSLNDLLPDSNGMVVNAATGLNAQGTIVGTYIELDTNGDEVLDANFNPVSAHGVMLLPDQITRDGNPITGTNANVWVGQQICLTNSISGVPTNAITSYLWHIPGVTGSTNDSAIYDYEPNQLNSNYTNLVTPTNYTTNSYIKFYYCGDATNLPVSCTQVIYGQTNTITATLNVQRPNAVISTDHGIIAVDAGSYWTIQSGTNYVIDPSTALHFGSVLTGATPGMKFGVNASVFPTGSNNSTNIVWNQVVNSDLSVISTATSALTSTNSGGYDSGGEPGDYPYDYGNEADDSPGRAGLQTNYTSCTRSFTATMYLMWQPSTTMVGGDKTVPVALRCWPWHWSATATNGAPSAGWGLENSTYPSTTSDVDVTVPPIWTNAAPYEWQNSGSL
jgi:hypothetical protein